MFTVTIHNGKPVIYDTIARVLYTGFKSWSQAQRRANLLNEGK